MKRKILSLVLCLALLFTTVFAGFTVVSAEETTTTTTSENLIKNGNFANGPTYWLYSGGSSTSSLGLKDVEIEGSTTKALKFASTAAGGKRHTLQTQPTIAIEKNAKYTTTFWVKLVNITSFRVFMYEPTYIDLNGEEKTKDTAAEGQNIYTYNWPNNDANGNPTSRVSRTDVVHEFRVAETDVLIDSAGPSMVQSRYQGTNQVLTPDYPNTEHQGEWFQIVHTFETGDDDAHKANVRYQFDALEAEGGEFWIADIQMHVERKYLPQVNDDTLGTVTPIPVFNGQPATITAEPYGENLFAGWYDGDKLVSKDAEFTFTYQANVTPQYTAHFEKTGFGTSETFEGYAKDQVLAKGTADLGTPADKEAGYVEFNNTQQNGSGFFIDASESGSAWCNATVSTDYALSGEYSLKFDGSWRGVGYKYTGLETNTYYTASVYGYVVPKKATETTCFVDNLYASAASNSYRNNDVKLNQVHSFTEEEKAAQSKGWTKFEVRFNTKGNTEVIFWLTLAGSHQAFLYLDNFAIARDTLKYTPNVNDHTLGYTSTVTTRVGSKTTVSATPIGEAIFVGWYNGDELISKNEEITFIYSADTANYEARFEGSDFVVDGSYETGYTDGQELAVLQHTTGQIGGATSDWKPDLWKQSSKDGNNEYFMESKFGGDYRKITVSSAYAYAGKYSLRFDGLSGFMGRKFADLEQNTDYVVSFYLLKLDESAQVGNMRITSADVAPVLANGNPIDYANCIAGNNNKYGTLNKWEKVTIKFNSGDNTEVIFWLFQDGAANKIFIDNLVIARTGQKIEVEDSAYGTTDFVKGNTYNYNEKVTITATPYEGNTFDGWYVGENCVSTEETHTFYAKTGLVITPKFSGNTYEHFAYNGEDGTFENGTVDGWKFTHPSDSIDWCKQEVSSAAFYEGSNSLLIEARHRNTILPLTNLEANTNYTISFMFKLNEVAVDVELTDENGNPTGETETKKTYLTAGIVASGVENIDAATVTFAKATIDSTAKWQKATLSFNTGNNTSLNLIIRFASESTAPMYLDNLTLMHKNSQVVYVSGDVDNNSNVNLNDLVTLAQYVAEWDVKVNKTVVLDVNGSGSVTLDDVTLFAKYLAGWNVTIK